MATYSKRYTASDDVKKKEQAYRDQLSAAPSYTSQNQQQIDSLRGDIMDRDPFKYDVNADALYQQLRDQYQQQGKMAMMDTIGQGAGLTGGYGNSYAQNAGQQAYQGYLRELNDQVPDLYGMALDQYIAEGDDMIQKYSMLLNQEAEDYGRWQDSYANWQNELNRLYNEYQSAADDDYSRFRDEVADDMWQTEYDETLRQYNLAMGLNADGTPVASSGGSGSGGSSDGGGSGGGSSASDASKYSTHVIRLAQDLVGTDADGVWGPNSEAAMKAAGFNSLDDVVRQLNVNTGSPAFQERPSPESYSDGRTSDEVSLAAINFLNSNPTANNKAISDYLARNGYGTDSAEAFRAYLNELR